MVLTIGIIILLIGFSLFVHLVLKENTGKKQHCNPSACSFEEIPGCNTVYKFEKSFKEKKCPVCDGENYSSARVCEICGAKL